jgi:septal ring factor EnvC (AmiA/AmiB activator)
MRYIFLVFLSSAYLSAQQQEFKILHDTVTAHSKDIDTIKHELISQVNKLEGSINSLQVRIANLEQKERITGSQASAPAPARPEPAKK